MLVVISMVTGDFLAMSSTTDNVRPSSKPNAWRIGSLTVAAGLIIGIFDLIFCIAVLAFGKFKLGLDIGPLRTLTMVTLVLSGQAVFYVVRERKRLWSSRPSLIVIPRSIADLLITPTMAVIGLLMDPLPISIAAGIFLACIARRSCWTRLGRDFCPPAHDVARPNYDY
jgi:H+-transporting ATPase